MRKEVFPVLRFQMAVPGSFPCHIPSMNDPVFRNVRFLPGTIHAGFPSPASDYEERNLDNNDLVVPQLMQNRKVFLKPVNPKYTAIEVTSRDDFEVRGVVSWVLCQC